LRSCTSAARTPTDADYARTHRASIHSPSLSRLPPPGRRATRTRHRAPPPSRYG
jgi:hypothetical protein